MWKTSTARLSSAITRGECRRRLSYTSKRCAAEEKGSTKLAYNAAPPPPQPPRPPPPPPNEGGRSFLGTIFKLLGVATVGVGGTVGYAWYDPNFRKTLEDNVPYSKEAMDTIFASLPEVYQPVSAPSTGGELKPIAGSGTKPRLDDQPLSFKEPKPEEKVVKPTNDANLQAHRTKEEQKRLAEQRQKEKEAEESAENAALEVILENLGKRAGEAAEEAVAVQQKLVEATKKHTELLKKAMEDTTEILDKDSQWQAVGDAFRDRETLSQKAKQLMDEARTTMDSLKKSIETGKQNTVTKKNKIITSAQEIYNKVNNKMRTVYSEVQKSESDARVMAKYKDLIDQGRKQFAEELDSIMPDVKLGNRTKKLTEEELNALIAHAHRRIEQLQRQLAEQMAMEAHRVEKALKQQQLEDAKLALQQVAAEAERLGEEFIVEKDKWDIEARADFEKELRQQLARQAAAHSDHLQDVLQVQASELERQCEREIHTHLLRERQSFQTEVSGWIARLKGIETAVEARAESEKIARVAQDLWLSCIALNGAIRHGNEEGEEWEQKRKPLRKEVEAVSDAGGKHPFVETLIQAIPEEALDQGVWSEDSLRERFPHVSTVCRRVAMLDDTGGTLFKYFISYAQSFFVFDSVYAKTEHDVVDLDKLDTFSILGHAEYWLEKGDLEQAVRFMNQLTGQPRRVAGDWVKEAKLLLETRQAAYAVTSFASASGLGTIF
ncbi:MICOS complex subunit MIC60-1-like [Babylonia areolata]|uniref:MICOS complex subunit MIC60-1-like n=1 Tax=Babylonia areolata TaxID=304850 RepID=UPI003FD5DE69